MKLCYLSFFTWPVSKEKEGLEEAGQFHSLAGLHIFAIQFLQMALKGTKLDTNGFPMAIKKNVIAWQLRAPLPDPVCDAHGLRFFA